MCLLTRTISKTVCSVTGTLVLNNGAACRRSGDKLARRVDADGEAELVGTRERVTRSWSSTGRALLPIAIPAVIATNVS